MHDMKKYKTKDKNPTTEGKTKHIAGNGKSRSYKYGKLHAGCDMTSATTLAFMGGSYLGLLSCLSLVPPTREGYARALPWPGRTA